jgi:tetrapyrrole methylase family protein/MazG family protein
MCDETQQSEKTAPAPDVRAGEAFARFAGTVAKLRDPQGGCPWDLSQTHESIAKNMIEEAHESVDAIERGDVRAMCEELGDVLLEVVLQAQIAADAGEFDIVDVIDAIDAKMVRRHPHVFGVDASLAALGGDVDVESVTSAADVSQMWDRIKLIERERKERARRERAIAAGEDPDAQPGLLDDVPRSMPALMQAQGIVRKAASVGFFWDTEDDVWEKVDEEVGEFKEALDERARAADDPDGAQGVSLDPTTGNPVAAAPGSGDAGAFASADRHASVELGDVLFTLVCVAHDEGLDAETALVRSCAKFRSRWAIIEREAKAAGKRVGDLSLNEMDRLWELAKMEERA